MTVYECILDRSCRGGSSTAASDQCFDGHTGALCGACDDGYNFDIARNRCAKCSGTRDIMVRAGNLSLLVRLLAALVTLLCMRFRRRVRWLRETVFLFMSQGLDALEHKESKEAPSEAAIEARSQSQKWRKSLLTKAKITIATWQIAASTETVRVHSPPRTFLIRRDNTGPLASSISTDLCESSGTFSRAWPRDLQRRIRVVV